MTLYKGKDALDVRRDVAMKLTPSLIKDLRKPRRCDDKPDWAPMQQLHDAGLSNDPVSGMPVFNPDACSPALLDALWRCFCGVATTINTKELGETDDALEVLKVQLREHAAAVPKAVSSAPKQLRKASSASAKRKRAESMDEEVDTDMETDASMSVSSASGKQRAGLRLLSRVAQLRLELLGGLL